MSCDIARVGKNKKGVNANECRNHTCSQCTGYEKKGRLYAVIQVRENGRTKPVWRALGLPESANKSKVNKAYREVVQAFEQTYAEQIAQNKKPASDIPIYDYMCAYFKKIEKNVQKSTAESYRGMING